MSENLNSDQQQQLLFMMLLQQHEQIAMMGLGKVKNPVTDKVERDLNSAKYAIDTLVMLEKFTKGNLSKELEGYLRQLLTNLRLNYADEKKKDPAKKQEQGASSDPNTDNEKATGDQKLDKEGASDNQIDDKKHAAVDEKTEKKEDSVKDQNESKEKGSSI